MLTDAKSWLIKHREYWKPAAKKQTKIRNSKQTLEKIDKWLTFELPFEVDRTFIFAILITDLKH